MHGRTWRPAARGSSSWSMAASRCAVSAAGQSHGSTSIILGLLGFPALRACGGRHDKGASQRWMAPQRRCRSRPRTRPRARTPATDPGVIAGLLLGRVFGDLDATMLAVVADGPPLGGDRPAPSSSRVVVGRVECWTRLPGEAVSQCLIRFEGVFIPSPSEPLVSNVDEVLRALLDG